MRTKAISHTGSEPGTGRWCFDTEPQFWRLPWRISLLALGVSVGLYIGCTGSGGSGSGQSSASVNRGLVLINPGDQTTMEGEPVTLPVVVNATTSETVVYSATNLPYGLDINTVTGVISGTIAHTAAVDSPYAVTIVASNGMVTTNTGFTWTVLAPGTVSGRVIVAPHHLMETEPNDTIAQAQTVTAPGMVAGEAAAHDTGFPIPGTNAQDVQDLYVLTTASPARLILTMATDDLLTNDLDLVLLDEVGNVLEVSEGTLATEVLDTPGAGTFVIGVRALRGASAYTLSITTQESFATSRTNIIPPAAAFVPGDILVKLKPQLSGTPPSTTRLAVRYGLSPLPAASPGTTLMRVALASPSSFPGKIRPILTLPAQEDNALKALTLETIRALRADPAVVYAEPNFLRQPVALPADEFVSLQWYHDVLNLPQAWEVTTGSDDIIVAVIDTGIALDHPDLQARLVAGPTEPAHIINISLSGPGFSHTLQEAIQAALAQGVIVVAAAGNQNTSTWFYPASYAGVISVAAVDRTLQKAPYSNFGSTIDVVAPGGDVNADRDGDGFIDGILSTSRNDAGLFSYTFLAGTSMAAPQVAGVLALMVAVNPHLTPTDVEQLLAGTHPATALPITRDLGQPGRDDGFGYGLIDAAAAVPAAQTILGETAGVATGPILEVAATTVDFGYESSALPIDVRNAGSGTLHITSITTDAPWLTIIPTSGTAPFTAYAIADRVDLPAGVYTATVQITADLNTDDHTRTLDVTLEVGADPIGDIGPTFVLMLDAVTSETVAQVETDITRDYTFTIPNLAPGTYSIVAGTDRDEDGIICETGDACGMSLQPVTITAGQSPPEIRLVIDSFVTPHVVPPGLGEFSMLTFSRRYE